MTSSPTRAGGTAELPACGTGTKTASARWVGTWAFTGAAASSLGGPLALAALIAPAVTADAASSAGLATIAAAVVFVAPLAIWLLYARRLPPDGERTGPRAGLYAFVLEAAGRRRAIAPGAG